MKKSSEIYIITQKKVLKLGMHDIYRTDKLLRDMGENGDEIRYLDPVKYVCW